MAEGDPSRLHPRRLVSDPSEVTLRGDEISIIYQESPVLAAIPQQANRARVRHDMDNPMKIARMQSVDITRPQPASIPSTIDRWPLLGVSSGQDQEPCRSPRMVVHPRIAIRTIDPVKDDATTEDARKQHAIDVGRSIRSSDRVRPQRAIARKQAQRRPGDTDQAKNGSIAGEIQGTEGVCCDRTASQHGIQRDRKGSYQHEITLQYSRRMIQIATSEHRM